MKIYAIRDRLIDYYMQPFVAPNDKEVMAALAKTVNDQGDQNAVAQAPHHFELWELGTLDEEGNITPTRKLVCDCASLIRSGIRNWTERQGATAAQTAGTHTQEHRGNGSPGGAYSGALPGQAPPAEGPADEIRRGPQGGYPPRDGG